MWKSLRDYTCYLCNHPKEVLDMQAACFRVWTRQRPAVDSALLLTYGKSPKVQSSFSNQSTSLLMPTSIFLSAEAKICQREIVFASYNRITEPTDTENVEYFIYLDLHKAFDIASQDILKSKQIRSRWSYYKSGFITGWKKITFRIVLNASMSERKVIFNQDVKEGMLTSIRFCVCVCVYTHTFYQPRQWHRENS